LQEPGGGNMKASLAIFLHSDHYDRLYQAASMVLAGATMGWPCHLFLFHQALASYVDGGWDNTDTVGGADAPVLSERVARLREGFETSNLPSLYEMLDKARDGDGELTVYACSSSVKVLGLDLQDVRQKVDEIVGLPTMLKISGGVTHMLYV
jgi:peroxiredoxin family protein